MRSLCSMGLALLLGCVATAPPAKETGTRTLPTYRVRPGVVESIEQIKVRGTSNAGGDVLTAILVGGLLFNALLFHTGTGSIVGAENGSSAIDVSADGDFTMLPRYRVRVRFDDGGSMTLKYTDVMPFHRGERVALTQQGLVGG